MWYGSQISWTRGLKNAFEDFWQCLILYNMAIAVTYETITERILPDTETIFLPGSNPLRVEVRLIVMGMKSKYSAKMFNVSVTFLFHLVFCVPACLKTQELCHLVYISRSSFSKNHLAGFMILVS